MYKLQATTGLDSTQVVQRLSDNAFIPMSEANTDYQVYLKWLGNGNVPLPAEGNTPLPAEENN